MDDHSSSSSSSSCSTGIFNTKTSDDACQDHRPCFSELALYPNLLDRDECQSLPAIFQDKNDEAYEYVECSDWTDVIWDRMKTTCTSSILKLSHSIYSSRNKESSLFYHQILKPVYLAIFVNENGKDDWIHFKDFGITIQAEPGKGIVLFSHHQLSFSDNANGPSIIMIPLAYDTADKEKCRSMEYEADVHLFEEVD